MTFWVLIALSFIAGAMMGALMMCLCVVAKRGDKE
jgi:uncharacterized membrane-anchored protein YhcB (DUF1043 family)